MQEADPDGEVCIVEMVPLQCHQRVREAGDAVAGGAHDAGRVVTQVWGLI